MEADQAADKIKPTHDSWERFVMKCQQNNVFIDPNDCGSSIGYHIKINEYTPKDKPIEYSISATVVLADCSHKIDWNFNEDAEEGDAIEKIEAAVSMLQEFKKKFIETQKLVSKLNK
jgi:hypothetical protein